MDTIDNLFGIENEYNEYYACTVNCFEGRYDPIIL